VVISASTHGLTGGLFEYRHLGTVGLKGFAENVSAWQVLGAGASESRFEALRSGRTALVGRAEEIELLLRRWQQVKSGLGRAVLITGEPGIGKSRIVAALQEHLYGDLHTPLRYFCSPHRQDSALHPLTSQLERAAGFARDDTAGQKLARLETLLAQSKAEPEEIGLFTELLSMPNATRYPLPELSPQKRKEKTLTALLSQMERLAARQPVLAVYEDVHWIDPTTHRSDDARTPDIDDRTGAASASAVAGHGSTGVQATVACLRACYQRGAGAHGPGGRRFTG